MATTLRPVLWFPSRGLNTASPAHEVPMDMASDGFDFVVEDNEIAKKRDGYATANGTAVSASPTINSLASLYLSSGTRHEVLGTTNGGVWEDQAGTVTASIFSGLSTSTPLNYTQFLDTLLILDGSTIPKTWDGSSTGQITAAVTGAKFGETHLEKFFLANSSGARSQVDYSATGDFNTYTGAGTDTFNVSQNDGQNISGLKSFSRNELVIFKDRSMYKLLGQDKASFNLLSIDKSIGCVSNTTVQNFKASTQGGVLIFAYRDGLYAYDGSTPRKISSYIQPFWDSLNKTRWEHFSSTLNLDKGRYMLACATGSNTTNNRIIEVDLLHPWTDENGLHFPIFLQKVSAQSLNTEIVSSTQAQRIVFGATAGIKNFFGTIRSDNGSAIDSYMVTPLAEFDDTLGNANCLRRATTAWKSTAGTITLDTEIKDGTEWIEQEEIATAGLGAALGIDFQLGVSALGVPEATFTQDTNIKARSRRIKVRLRQNSSDRFYNLQKPVELWVKTGGKR